MNIKTLLCASALVLGICGCDNAVVAPNGVATGPRTLDGALVSLGVEKAPFDAVLGDKKAKIYDKFHDELPGDLKDILQNAGLDDIEIKWGALSLVDFPLDENGNPDGVPSLFVALAFDHDFDKLVAALKEDVKNCKPKIEDATILGEKGIILSDDDMTMGWASIDSKILIVGTSTEATEKGVALYRDGKGGKAIEMDGAIAKLCVSEVGERIVKKMPAEQVKSALQPSVEDATSIMQGLKNICAKLAPSADNGVSITSKTQTAAADDAAKLAEVANGQLQPFVAMMTLMASQDPDSKPLVELLSSIKIAADGADVSASASVSGATFKSILEKALD